jgi:hypothetical protein
LSLPRDRSGGLALAGAGARSAKGPPERDGCFRRQAAARRRALAPWPAARHSTTPTIASTAAMMSSARAHRRPGDHVLREFRMSATPQTHSPASPVWRTRRSPEQGRRLAKPPGGFPYGENGRAFEIAPTATTQVRGRRVPQTSAFRARTRSLAQVAEARVGARKQVPRSWHAELLGCACESGLGVLTPRHPCGGSARRPAG